MHHDDAEAGAEQWPERLDLRGRPRTHTDHEHVRRYVWATKRVSGKILDAACGVGYGSALLATAGDVTAVDRDEAALAETARRAPSATVVRCDLPGLPFADDSFDTVVSFETIEHIDDDAGFLGEIRRVLRPGGQLLLSTPRAGAADDHGDNPWHVREYGLEEILALLSGAGFRVEETLGQRIPSARTDPITKQIRRVVARFPLFCRPGRWWDTIAHGSPEVVPWDGRSSPFFWILAAR